MSFIQSHLYDGTTYYVKSTIDLLDCVSSPSTTAVYTMNSGLYLEALSVFAYATHNDTLIQRYDEYYFVFIL